MNDTSDRGYRARVALRLLPLIIVVIASLPLCGCGEDSLPVYSEHQEFGAGGWDTFRALEFHPWPMDSVVDSRGYVMSLCVRYTGRTRIKTLPVTMEETALDGPLSDSPRETEIKIPLYSERNRPLGHQRHGIYELVIPLRRGLLPGPGYTVSFTHTLPESDTEGLLTFGVMLHAESSAN